MQIDRDRVAGIVEKYRYVDPHAAYHMMHGCRYQVHGPLVPQTRGVLRRTFAGCGEVLDIGCGAGATLVEHARLFRRGVGIDESAEHMIGRAIRTRDALGVRNVEFRVGKAASLPFDDESFDLVYSERGPLGHDDRTLQEALRVLRPGGLLFVETPGGFEELGVEKERFERHGVKIQTLATREQALRFDSVYDLIEYRCAERSYLGEALPSAEDLVRLGQSLGSRPGAEGRPELTQSTIWIGGSKGG